MDLYVYSDESGVFDYIHNDIYVFGGIIFTSKDTRDVCARKYSKAEKVIAQSGNYQKNTELKANILSNNQKGKLYRSLNKEYKFAAVVDQKKVYQQIFEDKKSKQRYLDFVYKMALKNAFTKMIDRGIFQASDIKNIYVFYDEHTTATNGIYELKEALRQEFKSGTYNWNYQRFFPPLFPNIADVSTKQMDSKKSLLIRSADIIANKVYHLACKDYYFAAHNKNIFVKRFP